MRPFLHVGIINSGLIDAKIADIYSCSKNTQI